MFEGPFHLKIFLLQVKTVAKFPILTTFLGEEIEDKRDELFRIIMCVLSRNSNFKYYQVNSILLSN